MSFAKVKRFFSLSNNQFAVSLYRLSHFCYRHRIPFLPFFFQRLNAFLHGIEIHFAASIGAGFIVSHSQGIVIGENVVIGDGCTIYSAAVLGVRHQGTGRQPKIGNRVLIGSGAKVLGSITVGDDAAIGANAVVLDDVPSCSVVAGIPARVVKTKAMNRV